MLQVELLELEIGYGLIPLVDSSQGGEILERIRSIRKQLVLSHGFIVPPIHIKDNLQLKPNEYVFNLKGEALAKAEVAPEQYMAMDPGTATQEIPGTASIEPAFGLPATWIEADQREQAQVAGYTVVDCPTVMATHLSEVIKGHAHELIGRQEVQNLLDTLSKEYPRLVEELVPFLLSLGGVLRVLQNLLKEEVSIRDLRTILETLADHAGQTQDPDQLTEYVRRALGRHISRKYAQPDQTIPVLTLDQEIEEVVQNSLQHTNQGTYLALDPQQAQGIIRRLNEQLQRLGQGVPVVLLCPSNIRLYVRKLIERYLPRLAVLSHAEISSDMKVQAVGPVRLDAS
jgi:flagellar biosynthesis protein FlhA